MMRLRRDPQAGVTLIEVLVALVIFSIVGLASMTLLDTVLRVDRTTNGQVENLHSLENAFLLIEQDLQNADPKSLEITDQTITFSRLDTAKPVSLRYQFAREKGALQRVVQHSGQGNLTQTVATQIDSLEWLPIQGQDTVPIALELAATFRLQAGRQQYAARRIFPLLTTVPE